ncbi:MAG: DUF192 domain-containing protein [Patescibacteria group bacterium]
MKLIGLFISIFFLLTASPALAIYDPLSVTNNRVGVHVLSPDELESAAKLVNNDSAGSWGYVTVPIQASDRDREKWTQFMTKATELKIIPIIRVATIVDDVHWLKPNDNDLIDFANFLNDLPWPTQNRYVVIFNEVNRADEFGGSVSPEAYADILNNAIDIFKRRSAKFFILPSALDNAAPNGGQFMRWDSYLTRMHARQPEIFNKIDGWNSHAYGNPGFSASPTLSGTNKADSFKSDLVFLRRFTQKELPVFITEAGWSRQRLDDRTIATFYNHAFYNAWADEQVIAVTPFLLFAGTEPFSNFSLLTKDSRPTLAYQAIQAFAVDGSPLLEEYPTPTPAVLEATPSTAVLGSQITDKNLGLWQRVITFFTGLFQKNPFQQTITVGEKKYHIEIVSSPADISLGLAKYDRLETNRGMLFDLKRKSTPSFWMKNMKFDIDIVWLRDGVVVGVSPGSAATPFTLINPPSAVDSILEVNPNSGIKVGDRVKIDS